MNEVDDRHKKEKAEWEKEKLELRDAKSKIERLNRDLQEMEERHRTASAETTEKLNQANQEKTTLQGLFDEVMNSQVEAERGLHINSESFASLQRELDPHLLNRSQTQIDFGFHFGSILGVQSSTTFTLGHLCIGF